MSKTPAGDKFTYLVLLGLSNAFVATAAAAILSVWEGTSQTLAPPVERGALTTWLPVATQTLCLFTPLLLISCTVLFFTNSTKATRLVMICTCVCFLALPVVVIYDHFAFSWTGRRLFSLVNSNMASHLPRLLPFVEQGAFSVLGAIVTSTFAIPVLTLFFTKWLAERVTHWSWRMRAGAFAPLFLVSWCLAPLHWGQHSADALATKDRQLSNQPFHVFGLLNTPSVGPLIKAEPTDLFAPLNEVNSAIEARQRRLRIAHAVRTDSVGSLPDVVLIVIESLRPELIAEDVMPNLAGLADQGIHCKYHFSGGNATNHGVFSLLTGLEPIWFDTAQRFDPGLLRWFKNVGYETGFFAGANDWKTFRMEGFISKKHFDEFRVSARNGIASDRRAVELASAFLSQRSIADDSASSKHPRLAVVYLYGTHATYQSYAADQVDQPTADDRYPFPYPPRLRDRFWNSYRNSARTVDRLIKPLFQPDRVIVAVGDHGEAFLEDGSIGHGIHLSRVQNMTGAVIYCPDTPSRSITCPTSHVDILPSLLACLNVELSDAGAIDGTSLLDATDMALSQRCFSTRNYLEPDYALIGPWTQDGSKPFAYRFKASINSGTATALNAIDEDGLQLESETMKTQAAALRKWQTGLHRLSTGSIAE